MPAQWHPKLLDFCWHQNMIWPVSANTICVFDTMELQIRWHQNAFSTFIIHNRNVHSTYSSIYIIYGSGSMEVFYQTTGILVMILMARSQISFSSWEIEHLGSKKFWISWWSFKQAVFCGYINQRYLIIWHNLIKYFHIFPHISLRWETEDWNGLLGLVLFFFNFDGSCIQLRFFYSWDPASRQKKTCSKHIFVLLLVSLWFYFDLTQNLDLISCSFDVFGGFFFYFVSVSFWFNLCFILIWLFFWCFPFHWFYFHFMFISF